jgi:MFS family permease
MSFYGVIKEEMMMILIHSSSISKAAVHGPAIGTLFMAFFGLLWSLTGVAGLQGWGGLYVLSIFVPGIALVFGGISLLRTSRKIETSLGPDQEALSKEEKRLGFWFNLIFIVQGLAIGITIFVCNMMNQTDLIPIVITMIVGIHFYPLAILFKIRKYHITGSLLILLALIALLAIPASLSIVGLGSALILYITGLLIWLDGRKILSDDLSRA